MKKRLKPNWYQRFFHRFFCRIQIKKNSEPINYKVDQAVGGYCPYCLRQWLGVTWSMVEDEGIEWKEINRWRYM